MSNSEKNPVDSIVVSSAKEAVKSKPLTLGLHSTEKSSGTVVVRRKRHVLQDISAKRADIHLEEEKVSPKTKETEVKPRVFTHRQAKPEIVTDTVKNVHHNFTKESVEAKVIEASQDEEETLKTAVVAHETPHITEHKAPAVIASTSTALTAQTRSVLAEVATELQAEKSTASAKKEQSDIEAELSELDVFSKIREINKQHKEAHDDSDELPDDIFNEEYDDAHDEDDANGMHFEHHKHDESSESEEEESLSSEDTLGKGTAVVRSSGNIGAFIRAANLVPLLTEEEEHELALRLKKYNDVEAARKLVMSHLRLVISVARGYTGYGLPLSDLIQEGNIGLMKAVHHFQPEIGGRLAAFAVHWIKAEIHDYVIRNWRMVKVATTKAQRKLFFKLRQNKKRLGWFTEHERVAVASDLGVTPTDVAEMETRLAGSDIGFDLDEDDSGEKGVAVTLSPSSYLEDESSNFAQSLEQSDYSSWELHKLKDAMEQLDERSRYILKRRWLDEHKATLQELSNELKVSIERVRQIENNAMQKIKIMLVNEGITGEYAKPSTALVVLPKKKRTRKSPKKVTKVSETPEVILAQGPALKALKAPEKRPLKHAPVVVNK